MPTFIHEAGWGIWPVFLFGLISLVLSVMHAVSPRRELVPLIVGFGVATVLAGLLGTLTGLQRSAQYIHEIEQKWIFLVGLRESLNCLVAALVIATLDALTAAVGSMRLVRQAPARLTGTA